MLSERKRALRFSAFYADVPQTVQCTDRFHLLKNLAKMLVGTLARHLAAHRARVQDWWKVECSS